MLVNIGRRILIQFIILSILRVFWIANGEYIMLTPPLMLIFLGLAIMITCFFECFDRLIVDYISYGKYFFVILILGIIASAYFRTRYHTVLLIYMFCILMKDYLKIDNMQKAIQNYQKNYQDNKIE